MRRQYEAIINHFSHSHPLHLTNPQPSRICSACKQTLETEPLYTCISPSCTTYSLHLKCYQLPHRITHPCHHNHPLSLLPKSYNPNGVFTCNACGKHGDGFSYNCKDCGINIHVVCATLPLSLSHRNHCHQLSLVFSPPYGSNAFSCDVCGVVGGNKSWLYRCGLCGFDAHLSCATAKAQVVTGGERSTGPGPGNLTSNQFNNQRNQYLQAIMGGNGGGNINNQILQAMMGGGGGGSLNNQILQAMMGGGGGNGSNPFLQATMGGGGVNNQILQAMMGGSGGSNPFLQNIMGGGGGGDLVQTLLNGSNGGFGGLDLSSVLGNVGDFGGLMGAGFGGFGF